MTTKQRVRDEAKLQELAAQVESLRTPEIAPYVEQTLQRIREWSEQQLLARFTQIRDATLEAAVHGNPKYREVNMQIVCVYDCVVTFLSGYEMRLAIYHSKICSCKELIYRGVLTDSRVLCVTAEILRAQPPTEPESRVYTVEHWLPVAIGGEQCWIAATCELCGDEFRPQDGYFEDEIEPTYSYCAQCCHW